jgi:hypothetical protein
MKFVFRLLIPAAILGMASLSTTATTAGAYGANEVAQLELSVNCDNPNFSLCAPPPAGGGTGGFWLWTALNSDGTADFSGAGCGHVVGGIGGPGGAGAGSIKGSGSWTGPFPSSAPGVLGLITDPNGNYYTVVYPHGGPTISYPATQGHYAFHPAPGVTIQLTVAP